MKNPPNKSYGILEQNFADSALDEAAEQVRNLGYAIIDSGYTAAELLSISEDFNRTRQHYIQAHGEAKLKSIDEFHTIRSPLTHGGESFLKLAMNANLLELVKKLIQGKFILNQQNGVINPPQEAYNQSAWHRDFPYQHFTTSKPIAINALFCVDDFTYDNGATFVLPASHKTEGFPSHQYIQKNAIQLEAKAGSYIVLDCMLFHTGGFNKTNFERRAVNHLYNLPYFKQQINISSNMKNTNLLPEIKSLLGFDYIEPSTISQYFFNRINKK